MDQKAQQFYYDQGIFEFGADTSLAANARENLTKTERILDTLEEMENK